MNVNVVENLFIGIDHNGQLVFDFNCKIVLVFSVKQYICIITLVAQLLTSELFNSNFQSLEVVSRYRDTQLQVTENLCDL